MAPGHRSIAQEMPEQQRLTFVLDPTPLLLLGGCTACLLLVPEWKLEMKKKREPCTTAVQSDSRVPSSRACDAAWLRHLLDSCCRLSVKREAFCCGAVCAQVVHGRGNYSAQCNVLSGSGMTQGSSLGVDTCQRRDQDLHGDGTDACQSWSCATVPCSFYSSMFPLDVDTRHK